MTKVGNSPFTEGIPTLAEYILVDNERVFVERFYKNEHGQWTLAEYKTPQDLLLISNIDFSTPLSELYLGVFE